MLIPSVDILNGRAVQLRRGRELVLSEEDAPAVAERFARAAEIAVIDLDAALGQGENDALVRAIARRCDCRVGGGVRSVARARELLAAGAARVIVGSAAFNAGGVNHEFLGELRRAVGPDRVIVAVDAAGEEIVTAGWRRRSGLDLWRVVPELEPYCSEFLFTAVEREGEMQGTDTAVCSRLRSATGHFVTVAGGVRDTAEIERLTALGLDVQIGMALYTGAVSLADGVAAAVNWKTPLLPTVVCDEQERLLMLAYSSRESLRLTLASGRMHFHSRSRDAIWEKGATSGNTMELVRLRLDCDRDTLKAVVRPAGPACHSGRVSCFSGRTPFTLADLYGVVRQRLAAAPPGSYTASLDDAGLAAKIREEAEELIEARERAEIVWEAADLLYFTTVRLARAGVEYEEVLAELRRRREK